MRKQSQQKNLREASLSAMVLPTRSGGGQPLRGQAICGSVRTAPRNPIPSCSQYRCARSATSRSLRRANTPTTPLVFSWVVNATKNVDPSSATLLRVRSNGVIQSQGGQKRLKNFASRTTTAADEPPVPRNRARSSVSSSAPVSAIADVAYPVCNSNAFATYVESDAP